MENQTGKGFLKVRVTTAGRTVPVNGAVVKITEYSRDKTENSTDVGQILYSLRTDERGLTQTVVLPAPPASESMKPGDPLPYALYNIYVTYDGYYSVEGIGVPIFDNGMVYQCTQRNWGGIMVMAYPEEIDDSDGMGYTTWAWISPIPMIVPNNDDYNI